jgi:nucleoside-diphosphate-sugar epimerase
MKKIEASDQVSVDKLTRLNIGCGDRPLKGYINVDQDSIEDSSKFTEATGWKLEYDFDSGLIAAYQSYFPK